MTRLLPLLCLLVLVTGLALAEPKPQRTIVHHERSTLGHEVFVVDIGDRRFLRFDTIEGQGDQSMIAISDPEAVPMEYVRYAVIGLAYTDKMERVLMIGLGGGTWSTLLHRSLPNAVIDVVEIDPLVVKLARLYFGVPVSERLRIHTEDGAAFIKRTRERYDLIFLDAYTGADIPAKLATPGFLARVGDRLAEGGAVMANVALNEREDRDFETMFRGVFPHTASIRTPVSDNLLLIGRPSGGLPTREQLWIRAGRLNGQLGLRFDLRQVVSGLGTDLTKPH